MSHEIYAACIEACNACAVECNNCAASCLKDEHASHMARCIALDIDCAQVCAFAAAAMARGSEHVAAICMLCAEICQFCADECAKHSAEHCKTCAAACQRCADACRAMAKK